MMINKPQPLLKDNFKQNISLHVSKTKSNASVLDTIYVQNVLTVRRYLTLQNATPHILLQLETCSVHEQFKYTTSIALQDTE